MTDALTVSKVIALLRNNRPVTQLTRAGSLHSESAQLEAVRLKLCHESYFK